MRRTSVAIVLLLMLATAALWSQNVSTGQRASGATVGAVGSFGSADTRGVAVGAGYSIGGVLDLGLVFGLDINAAESAVTSDIGMAYSFAPIRQGDGRLLSAAVYGSYTFRAEDSDFLDRNGLVNEARGYTLGVATTRDFRVIDSFALRIAAFSEYTNYLEMTTVGFDAEGFTGSSEVDYGEYPRVRRLSGFVYGPYLGILARTPRGARVLAGASVAIDPYLQIEVRPDVQVLLTR